MVGENRPSKIRSEAKFYARKAREQMDDIQRLLQVARLKTGFSLNAKPQTLELSGADRDQQGGHPGGKSCILCCQAAQHGLISEHLT